MEIALVTYAAQPELPEDDRLLLGPLQRLGLTARPVVWDDPGVDWSRFRLAVLRATWDYFVRPREFLAWLDRVEPLVPLYNTPRTLRWNSHKRYLVELAQAGVPVTPTEWVRGPTRLAAVCEVRGWSTVVVKPAVSGGGRLTRAFSLAALSGDGQAHLAEVLREGDALVQPLLPGLSEDGERSYIFVDGELTHAVHRPPTLGAEVIPEGRPLSPRESDLAVARQVLRQVATLPLYARVDLATGLEGTPVLSELELIEPRLFFFAQPEAASRMAQAIARRCA